MQSLNQKGLPILVLGLNISCNLQQLRIFFNNFFNLKFIILNRSTEGLKQEVSFKLLE